MSKSLVLVLLVSAVLAGGLYWYFAIRPVSLDRGYCAVFLANGQVYFGKLRGAGSDSPVLSDVFYLVTKRPLQSASGEAPPEGDVSVSQGQAATPEYSLVKLGGEVHGPVDAMSLNRQHILFIEELRDDSKIVEKIQEFKAQGNE